ncbi:MAG: hypothetical protein K2R98_12360 [Gemmataceae bacterium]|nr:hypothetical protein [Gemmataceae bacterium]
MRTQSAAPFHIGDRLEYISAHVLKVGRGLEVKAGMQGTIVRCQEGTPEEVPGAADWVCTVRFDNGYEYEMLPHLREHFRAVDTSRS